MWGRKLTSSTLSLCVLPGSHDKSSPLYHAHPPWWPESFWIWVKINHSSPSCLNPVFCQDNKSLLISGSLQQVLYLHKLHHYCILNLKGDLYQPWTQNTLPQTRCARMGIQLLYLLIRSWWVHVVRTKKTVPQSIQSLGPSQLCFVDLSPCELFTSHTQTLSPQGKLCKSNTACLGQWLEALIHSQLILTMFYEANRQNNNM